MGEDKAARVCCGYYAGYLGPKTPSFIYYGARKISQAKNNKNTVIIHMHAAWSPFGRRGCIFLVLFGGH